MEYENKSINVKDMSAVLTAISAMTETIQKFHRLTSV